MEFIFLHGAKLWWIFVEVCHFCLADSPRPEAGRLLGGSAAKRPGAAPRIGAAAEQQGGGRCGVGELHPGRGGPGWKCPYFPSVDCKKGT